MRKEIFPFEYWDSFEKSKEGLPSRDKFYNSLNNCEISDEDYEYIVHVRETFRMKT